VRSLDPPAIVEAAVGSGGLCGGSFLNRIFAAYLDGKFVDYSFWDSEYQSSALVQFERQIKKYFTGDEERVYSIRVRGLSDNPLLGIRGGVLAIPAKDIKGVFEPVVKEIVQLVKGQILATEKQVKAVLLAGGFGGNEYLGWRLRSELGTGTDVRSIENR
jgi:hypothetical protein